MFTSFHNHNFLFQFHVIEHHRHHHRLTLREMTPCCRSVMEALRMGLSSMALGATNSGKTETLKDLTKAVGKKGIVYNCNRTLDCIVLGKFFKVRTTLLSRATGTLAYDICTITSFFSFNVLHFNFFENREIKKDVPSSIVQQC